MHPARWSSFLGGMLLLVTPAFPATVCVRPAGGTCKTTVTAAVAVAKAGDTISIAPGVYNENITVPSGLDGLRIIGTAAAIIDAESGGGVGITVVSNGVLLLGFTLRNGKSDGIVVTGSGLTMSFLKVLGPDGDCIRFSGAGAGGGSIKYSRIQGCGNGLGLGHGIVFGDSTPTLVNNITILTTVVGPTDEGCLVGWGDDFHMTASTCFGSEDNTCVDLNQGDRAVVKGNILRDCDSDGIDVTGAGATVSSNRVYAAGAYGIDVSGANATVSANVVVGAYGDGIYVQGAAPTVAGNTTRGTDSYGVEVRYADGAKVTYNRVDGPPGYEGIYVTGNGVSVSNNTITSGGGGILVVGDTPTLVANVVSNVQEDGIAVSCNPCNGGLVKLNKVTDVVDDADAFDVYAPGGSGGVQVLLNVATRGADACFNLNGTAMTVSYNKGYDCGGDTNEATFYVFGTNHVLTGNYAKGSSGDGFHLLGSGHTLASNTADHTTEDGFDVHAIGVTLAGNKALYNTGSGFEVDGAASNTTLTGNVALGNKVGLCDAGTSTTIGVGNSFGTTAPGPCDYASGYVGN